MNITQEEFSKRIHEIIEDKIFFSNISGNPVEVVEKLPEEIYIKNTKYHSWTLHEEKVLKTFLKMYESSK